MILQTALTSAGKKYQQAELCSSFLALTSSLCLVKHLPAPGRCFKGGREASFPLPAHATIIQ